MDDSALVRVTGVVVYCLNAALAALFAVLLTPLYVGSVLLPVAVLVAVLSMAALPPLARRAGGTTLAAVAPLIVWVLVVLGLSLPRPEGDVLLPGGTGGQTAVSYGVVLAGVVAGIVSVALSGRRRPASASGVPLRGARQGSTR